MKFVSKKDSANAVTIIRNLEFDRTSPLYKEYHTRDLDLVEYLMENWDDGIRLNK